MLVGYEYFQFFMRADVLTIVVVCEKARKKPRPERSPVGATSGYSVTVPGGDWNKSS